MQVSQADGRLLFQDVQALGLLAGDQNWKLQEIVTLIWISLNLLSSFLGSFFVET